MLKYPNSPVVQLISDITHDETGEFDRDELGHATDAVVERLWSFFSEQLPEWKKIFEDYPHAVDLQNILKNMEERDAELPPDHERPIKGDEIPDDIEVMAPASIELLQSFIIFIHLIEGARDCDILYEAWPRLEKFVEHHFHIPKQELARIIVETLENEFHPEPREPREADSRR